MRAVHSVISVADSMTWICIYTHTRLLNTYMHSDLAGHFHRLAEASVAVAEHEGPSLRGSFELMGRCLDSISGLHAGMCVFVCVCYATVCMVGVVYRSKLLMLTPWTLADSHVAA